MNVWLKLSEKDLQLSAVVVVTLFFQGKRSRRDLKFFTDWVLGPKNGLEDFAGEPYFLCRVCDTGKPDGACREAESIQKSSPRCQQSGFNKTTRRVGRMLFLMEMRTAPQRETQNRTVLSILQ